MPSPQSGWRLVLLVCIAQTLVQIGAFFWPALLPQLAPQWGLSNSGLGSRSPVTPSRPYTAQLARSRSVARATACTRPSAVPEGASTL
jgi:hypothetical protein